MPDAILSVLAAAAPSTTSILLASMGGLINRQGGIVNGPRAYFHDPDGTVLEFIDLTSYAGSSIR